MTSTSLLRSSTKDQLDALERSPLFDAMVDEGPPHALYAAWLRIVAVVVGALEHALDDADDAEIRRLWRDELRALPRLRADLVVLDEVPARATSAIEPMLVLVDELRRWGREQPLRSIGALYASGSMHAGSRPYERLAGRFGPGVTGLAYVSSKIIGTEPSWKSFCRRLDAIELSSQATEHIVDAARSFLARMIEIVEALVPRDGDEQAVIQALNADAGHHEVTHDPREVMAAIDAGVRTWDEHPYYEARYGARGRRFTRSDSAWLVVLADQPEPVRLARLDWLAKLLAARGMPSLLLEAHMHNLREALVAAVPERAARYDGLQAAGRHLRDRRLAALPRFDELAASVPVHEALGDLGPVLVSAVADERRGARDAVSSVEAWVFDPQRSSREWCAAVRHALEQARRS